MKESLNILKNHIISNALPNEGHKKPTLSYYQLIYLLIDNKNDPIKLPLEGDNTKVSGYFVFTSKSLISRFTDNPDGDTKVRSMMLGHFISELENESEPSYIKVNPILTNPSHEKSLKYLCDEIIFAPILDPHTKKLMMTDPEDAKALYAINPKDQERFCVETVFHIISENNLPIDPDQREIILKEKIKDLAFICPRVPIKKGSASFYVVILSLANEMEETAFIRSYCTFDNHIRVIFLNSRLSLTNGDLDSIPYDNKSVDGIFSSLVNWESQKLRNESHHFLK